MVIKELVLVIGALLIFGCIARERTLKNGVTVLHVENNFGNFLNIYDHQINIRGFKSTIVKKSKIECRWIQMAISAEIASVGPKRASDDGFECRTHNLTLGKTNLTQAVGWTTFLAVPEDAYFSPEDGLFYTTPANPKIPNCCLNNGIERLPIARTENQKKLLTRYLEKINHRFTYVGAHVINNQIYWNDTSPLYTSDNLFNCNNYQRAAYFDRNDQNVTNICTLHERGCKCTTNIFGRPWVE